MYSGSGGSLCFFQLFGSFGAETSHRLSINIDIFISKDNFVRDRYIYSDTEINANTAMACFMEI